MNIEVKNSVKLVDYTKSMKILERRVHDVFLGRKDELLWIVEHTSVYTAGTSSKNIDLLNKNLSFGGSFSNTVFFFFSSKFSIIFKALSDYKRFNIFTID